MASAPSAPLFPAAPHSRPARWRSGGSQAPRSGRPREQGLPREAELHVSATVQRALSRVEPLGVSAVGPQGKMRWRTGAIDVMEGGGEGACRWSVVGCRWRPVRGWGKRGRLAMHSGRAKPTGGGVFQTHERPHQRFEAQRTSHNRPGASPQGGQCGIAAGKRLEHKNGKAGLVG